MIDLLQTEQKLVVIAESLLKSSVDAVSPTGARDVNGPLMKDLRSRILAGEDPLGVAFIRLRTAPVRRKTGTTYTPQEIVRAMVAWAGREGAPVRVVDPGAGSGRFLMAAGQAFPSAELVGVEVDPTAALILQANLAVQGLMKRATVKVADFRSITLPDVDGPTLFIGNPPYVRHHEIQRSWKRWFANLAAMYGVRASKLAGLHIHFFTKTLQLGRVGDYGAFVTSAEWLDVNYGVALRRLLAGRLGGCALHIIDPRAMPFADATTTAAITCFKVGRRHDALAVRTVESLKHLDELKPNGRNISWSELSGASRWSTLIRPYPKPPRDYIRLGDLCRVHRGQVTGANHVWIAAKPAESLPPQFLIPAITKARELFQAGSVLSNHDKLRRIVSLPADLNNVPTAYRREVDRFLAWAKDQGADQSYIARHRRAWWATELYEPAPIICTYMARRPPAFVRNLCRARHLNIAHGLYPIEPLSDEILEALADYLRRHVRVQEGRTYAGGLTKFEPRELERIPVPNFTNLLA